ncbi:hypothetical protein Ddye_020256 [Dipteronia dyeriana]|uniref:RNase H type-1 domain-containing protein n=1 Tax=Dipteronia dyeriana TaxID=168575 RepID=A0AAD9WVU4_9ROSI|nr:hypothetical protein Ddye_020256 [Dipteronia dyeriana]
MPDDADLILQVPCSLAGRLKSFIWHYEKRGSFSVKCVYHLACSLMETSSSSGSGLESSTSWWKYLWRLKIPAKVRLHVWRACKDWLPVMSNLVRRGISEEFRRANLYTDNCSGLNGPSSSDYDRTNPFYRPLDAGLFKINTDAAIDASTGRVGVGVIIRDYNGMVIASCTQSIYLNYSLVLVESVVVLRGLRFAFKSGIWPCVIESDSQVVVLMVNSGSSPLDEIGLIVDDIADMMNSIPRCRVCFISRKANMAAHYLAKLGCT